MHTAREKNNNLIRNYHHVHPNGHWYPVLRTEDAKLSDKGLSQDQREFAWSQLHNHLSSYQNAYLGFQSNQSFDVDRMKKFLNIALNNDGDPFSASSLDSMNTKVMECAVLDYFAKLWGIKQSYISNEEERAYWGYITSMGSSESNLLALFNARDYLAGMQLNHPMPDTEGIKEAGKNIGESEPGII